MGLAMCTVQTGNAALRCPPPPTSDGSAGSPLLSPGGLDDLVVNVSTGTQSTWVTSSEVPAWVPLLPSQAPGSQDKQSTRCCQSTEIARPEKVQRTHFIWVLEPLLVPVDITASQG